MKVSELMTADVITLDPDDNLGSAVHRSGDTIIVGAYFDGDAGVAAGSAVLLSEMIDLCFQL